jgi:carboxyl-terminal processing protease
MTKAMLTGLLGAWLLVVAVLPARAAEPRAPQPYVVLVGISEFADKQIQSRPHAEDDIKALYDLFTDKKYLGADADHVRLLLGKEDAERKSQPATKDNILKALEWLKEAKQDDTVIFAYMGQGCSLGDNGDRRCYFGSDSTLKDRSKDGVASSHVAEIFDKIKSQKLCALIDVNFKGFTSKDPIPEATLGSPPYKEFLGDDGSDEHNPLPGRVVFLATNGLLTSLDLEKHGVFTQALLDGLTKGAADKDGYEPDGVVTIDELNDYLEKEMPELLKKYGTTKEEKNQAHWVLPLPQRMTERATPHFVLVRNPEVAGKVQEALTKLDKLAADKKISTEFAEEGHTLLAQMPRLESQRELRKAYQKLVAEAITPEAFTTTRKAILDSTKLDRATAKKFATKVLEASQTLHDQYVKKVEQPELVAWAIRGLYRKLEEKIPADVTERLTKIKELNDDDLIALLTDVRQRLGKREDLDKHKDVDISLEKMTSHLDPHTTYYDPEVARKMGEQIGGEFKGVGIQIRKDPVSDMLMVVTPIKNSPAHKAGIYAGDLITTVTRNTDENNKELATPEVFSTKGMAIDQAVKKIKGKEGTKVKLTIQREGASVPLDFELVRSRVAVESVLGIKRKHDGEWDFYVDPENKIGYIRLTEFQRNSFKDMKEVMDKLTKAGLKGFILDLRFNPGGLLDVARDISDLFIDDGLIVTIRPRVGREHPMFGKSEGSLLNFPMVCMVNGQSASGSEIVSACLQDHKRALIVGERSYGKGSVQNIQPFDPGNTDPDEDKGELKFTTATFWRPSNKNLNKSSTSGKEEDEWGVRPDKGYLVELSRKERDDLYEHQRNAETIPRPDKPPVEEKTEFKDVQLDKALEYLRGQIKMAAATSTKKAG